jgi:hypothetical protein
MATTPTGITAAARGVALTLTGFVVLNYSTDESPIRQSVPDQNGAIAEEPVYDKRYDLSLTCYCATAARTPPVTSGDLITFATKSWYVDKVAEVGSYNDLLKWTITAHRFTNCPA